MSSKSILGLVVVIVVVCGVWYFWSGSTAPANTVVPQNTQEQSQATQPVAGSDQVVNANTSLDQDMNSIDAQATAAADASASANSTTDAPVAQTE